MYKIKPDFDDKGDAICSIKCPSLVGYCSSIDCGTCRSWDNDEVSKGRECLPYYKNYVIDLEKAIEVADDLLDEMGTTSDIEYIYDLNFSIREVLNNAVKRWKSTKGNLV